MRSFWLKLNIRFIGAPAKGRAREKIMPSCLKRIATFVVCLVAVLPVHALQASPGKTSSGPVDPLGRGTPSGAVFGFLQAAQSGNYRQASQYLQMSPAHRQSEGEDTAEKLKVVMDRAFAGNLKNVSTQPEGTPQEGVPLDRQRLGTMSSGDVEANLDLVRVSEPNVGKIWLFPSDMLAKVPELYDQHKRAGWSRGFLKCW